MDDHCDNHRFYTGLCADCLGMRKAYIAYGRANPFKPKAPQAVYPPMKKTIASRPAPVVPHVAEIVPSPDITEKRHGGNKFSVAANPGSSKKSDDIAQLYAWWVAVGSAGAIAEVGYEACGLVTQTGSARCSDMKKMGLLVETGREGYTHTGNGAAVLVADIYAQQNGLILESGKIDEGDDSE